MIPTSVVAFPCNLVKLQRSLYPYTFHCCVPRDLVVAQERDVAAVLCQVTMLRRMLKLTAKAAEAAAKGAANLLGGSPSALEEQQQQQAHPGAVVQPSCTVRLLPTSAVAEMPPDSPAAAKHTRTATAAGAVPASSVQRTSPRSAGPPCM